MQHGVGIDLIDVEEVRGAIDTFGERYLSRVFTPAERHQCGTNPERLAEAFAAKEAAMKALAADDGPGGWHEIEVTRDSGSRPVVRLTGMTAERARRRGVTRLLVSLARQRNHAVAVAMLEARR